MGRHGESVVLLLCQSSVWRWRLYSCLRYFCLYSLFICDNYDYIHCILQLLQIGGCAPADPTSGDVPEGALLYLSVRAEGEITYECDANGVPTTVIGESAEISFSEENYEGQIALNAAGVLEASVISEDGAENTIIMGSDVAFSTGNPPLVLPKARWTVEVSSFIAHAIFFSFAVVLN